MYHPLLTFIRLRIDRRSNSTNYLVIYYPIYKLRKVRLNVENIFTFPQFIQIQSKLND